MKNIIRLISLALVCFMLTSCAGTASTTATSGTTANTMLPDPNVSNSPPPIYVTALNFDRDLNEAKKFIETNDLSETSPYYEYAFEKFNGISDDSEKISKLIDEQRSFFQMAIDAFLADGYLYRVTAEGTEWGTFSDESSNFLYFGPYVVNSVGETIMPHLSYRVNKGDYNCKLTIYHIDNAVMESVKDSDDVEMAYLNAEHNINDKNITATYYTGDNLGTADKIYVREDGLFIFMLDDTHSVIAIPNNTDIGTFIEFAKTLTFEKVPLEK